VSWRGIVCVGLTLMGITLYAMPTGAQSIVRVEIRNEGEPPPLPAGGVQERQMPKFLDDWEWPGDIVYDVRWEAPATGVTAPVSVLMVYRVAGSRDERRLIVEYPGGTRGTQIARFRIGADQVQREGAVTAWRIQLRQGARVLDERVTGRWR